MHVKRGSRHLPAVRSYCRSFAVSNAHSDRTDAAMIARYTFHYHGELRALERASGPMRHLRSLVEHRRTLVDERTVLTNRLQALLKLYFPQALKLLSEDLWRPMNCEFLLRWPWLQALRKARFSTLDAFWAAHGSRSAMGAHARQQPVALGLDQRFGREPRRQADEFVPGQAPETLRGAVGVAVLLGVES